MKPYLKIKDYSVSNEEFQLLHHEALDMLETYPQPENLETYYESKEYISHTDANQSFVDRLYQIVKKYSLRKKIELISKFLGKQKTLLDVGAGTGDFVRCAKNRSWQVDGVEPNAEACKKAKDKGLSLFNNLESITNKKYEVITLWHVLEHLPDLENQILKLTNHLEVNGTLVIAVPNFNSYDANYYKEFWAAYDVPRHLWHFSKSSIEGLFAKHNMKLVNIKPMVFDAFYVAMLSEKYKTGKSNLLKALVVGLRSNLKGLRSKEYSSHIYILKKG